MENAAKEPRLVTAEEFYRLAGDPDERTELHHGEIIAMASPGRLHQRISSRMHHEIDAFLLAEGGACEVNEAVDARLDDLTVVVPDIMVVCDPSRLDDHGCVGAPDWVVEITSSNRENDFDRKLFLYRTHGVKEYWIVDTLVRKVWVYCFEQHPNAVGFYDWKDEIPVTLYQGRLKICIEKLL